MGHDHDKLSLMFAVLRSVQSPKLIVKLAACALGQLLSMPSRHERAVWRHLALHRLPHNCTSCILLGSC